jgi:signal transduction histidine kinase/ActR/RegA family two-component response regulator
MEAAFVAAEAAVSAYFKERRDAPEEGTIEIFGERYVLVRAASLSVEFFQLVRGLYGESRKDEADAFARSILFDLAHAVGKSDAKTFNSKMGLTDPIARLSAGPVHFAHAGWAFVDISPESHPSANDDFYLLYDHPYSFESEAWIRAGMRSAFPVCIMNSGYSSGWCDESFGVRLVASEALCRARGDASCRFVMAPPSRIEQHLQRVFGERASIPDFFVRKKIEDELVLRKGELERHVAERTRALEKSNELLRREMRERAEVERLLRQTHKLEAVGRLAGGIAHDFNNLINVVIGRSERIRKGLAPDDPTAVQLAQITAAAERAAALTRQLLAFSTTHALQREEVDVNAVLRDMGDVLLPLIGEDVTLTMTLDDDAGGVVADRSQIEQLVLNLAVNARDAMPQGGTLAITTGRRGVASRPELGIVAGEYVILSVRDTGKGMGPETLAHIFEPFFSTKDPGERRGMGLSTVYGIVRQNAGAIEVDSTPGGGARFDVILPRIGLSAKPKVVAAPAEPAPSRARASILLVEDQRDLRSAIRDLLTDEGYVVHEAATPEEALKIAEQTDSPIDLLMTDVIMPEMGGRELATILAETRPKMRILYMSGYPADADLRVEVRAGTAAFLAKPFTPSQLSAKLHEVLKDRP